MNDELLLQHYMDVPVSIPSILMTNYAKLGLTEEQFMLLLHIRCYAQEGNFFPTPDQLQSRMIIDSERCTYHLKKLLTKGFLSIQEEQDEDGRLSEAFSLRPLMEKIVNHLLNQAMDRDRNQKKIEEGQLFQRFEVEFSRPLSPMEMEMISMWLDEDNHAPVIIEAALREAVVSQKINFRYIDRILHDWKKNGIKTVQQAKEHGERIRNHHQNNKTFQEPASSPQNKTKHPRYNWLKG
ncbi:MAG: DnaD domain-containing protein [Bacillus sp. (in: Bacteria)]|nr:DnaD domain-containing protein [Bacillus sp. (in: firmicutes)]